MRMKELMAISVYTAVGLAGAGRRAPSSGAELFQDLEDHTRLGGVLWWRDVELNQESASLTIGVLVIVCFAFA